MSSMIVWMLGIGVSVACLVLTAALQLHYAHIIVACMVSMLFAITAISETRGEGQSTDHARIAGTSLRFMGLVWTWGAIGLLVTYAFRILTWREWTTFFVAFAVMAGLTLFLSATLKKDADGKATDPTMLMVARGYSIFVFVAMIAVMLGLVIDGKLWRFATAAGQRDGWQDWAANHIFFFGAAALASIAANLLAVIGFKKS